MTFLLDHDVPDELRALLIQLGHRVIHLREVQPRAAPDSTILQWACEHQCVLITCNRDDFLRLARQQPHHGITILIRRRSRVAERAALLRLLNRAGPEGISNNINFA